MPLFEYCSSLQSYDEQCKCQSMECLKIWNSSVEAAEACYMENCFLSKRALEDKPLYQVTAAYLIILLIGVIGNAGICLVIRRHPLLKTHSSSYLLNLAVSDLVTLCVGLPFETFLIWHQYPWPFPDSFCNLKALLAETTNSVTALTILLFSIERYIAICHPFLFVKLKPVRKNVVWLLILAWILSILCAIPYANHHTADYFIRAWPYTSDGPPVTSSKMCMLNIQHMATDANLEQEYFELKVVFHFSAMLFFVVPLGIIIVMYFLIACKIAGRRHTVVYSRADSSTNNNSDDGNLRITFILTSLVITFFVCYLPFQFQRLAFFYIDLTTLTTLNQYLYYISGFLFYLATIVNPILYNLVSSRFRKASKEVFLSLLPCRHAYLGQYYPRLKLTFPRFTRGHGNYKITARYRSPFPHLPNEESARNKVAMEID